MKLHYIKIGASVLAVALVTYVFFPVNARHMTPTSTQAGAASARKTTHAASARTKPTHKQSNHHSTALAKDSGQQIEPDKTLRKQQSPNRSGPPSKMYGGL